MSYRPEANWLEKYSRWQLNAYNETGARKTFTTNTPGRIGKRICQDKADDWIRLGTISASDRLSTYLDNYLVFLNQYATKSDYRPRYTHIENHIRPILGNKKLSLITEADWESVLRRAASDGLSHKYISNIRSTIIHFCKFAKKRKFLTSIPEIDCNVFKNASKGKRRILQPEDIAILFSSNHVLYIFKKKEIVCRNIFLFRTYVLSGFRPGEAIGMLKSNVDFEKHSITVSQAINYYGEITAGKTDNAQRTICMMPQLEAVIKDQLNFTSHIKSDYVFPDQNESRIGLPQRQNQVYKDWCRWVSHNISSYCSLYELQHTLYSYAKDHVSEERLKEYFGHSESMNSSEVYGHTVFIELERTAQLMTKVFDNLIPNAIESIAI